MKVGEYARTDNGYIGKIIEIEYVTPVNAKHRYIYILDNDITICYEKEDIIKSSPNIIDLIEVGDFITYRQGNIYWDIPERVSGRYNREDEQTDLIANDTPLEHLEILSIVTKEQFVAMQYKVGE